MHMRDSCHRETGEKEGINLFGEPVSKRSAENPSEARELGITFAKMSLGGFNAGKQGARCDTAERLLSEWWEKQEMTTRRYFLSPGNWEELEEQARRIMGRRKNGPQNGVSSSYWDIVSGH